MECKAGTLGRRDNLGKSIETGWSRWGNRNQELEGPASKSQTLFQEL